MRLKILKWGLLIIVLVGFAILLFQYSNKSPNKLAPLKLAHIQGIIGIPARIIIPSINVDAAIEQVSVTADGFMDVPKFPLDAAWYELGPRPGEKGSAVIDGHVDWYHGAKAVFLDLHSLKPGDKIEIQDDQGAVITFVVREIRSYDPNADVPDVFGSNDGKAHLNLITCGGVWNAIKKTHSERLVVFTDKEVK